MVTGKSLYFLHIPKTGGLSMQLFQDILTANQVTHFPNRYDKKNRNFTNFSDYKFISWHFGTTPLQFSIPGLETAVLLREPLERVISNFCWLLMLNQFDFLVSYENLTVLEK